jgi:hypothetical protein
VIAAVEKLGDHALRVRAAEAFHVRDRAALEAIRAELLRRLRALGAVS